ncbi:MAG: hypothetical protein ACOCZ8_02120, partial [Bacteroidota bacterium]
MALQRLWSKDFYESIDEEMRPKIRVTAVGGILALVTVALFGGLYLATGRTTQAISLPVTGAFYLFALFILARREFDLGRVLLSAFATLGTLSLTLATGPEFGGWIYLVVIIAFTMLSFKVSEYQLYVPIIILAVLALISSFLVPGRVDLGGWYQPYDAEFNMIVTLSNAIQGTAILFICFLMIVKQADSRLSQALAAKREAEAKQKRLVENAREFEHAVKASQIAEKKANEHANELANSQFQLEETLERMKEREAEVARKNEELQSSEEELRQNLEELEATQEQMRQAQEELSLKNEIFEQSIVPIAAGTNVLKHFNRAFYKDLLGYDDDDELQGKRLRELAPEHQPDGRKSVEVAKELAQTLADQPEMTFEWLFQRKDGSTVL